MGTLIIGGGGMVGQKLAHRLARTGTDPEALALFDLDFPARPFPGVSVTGDVTNPEAITRLLKARPDPIFHLAAIVSGQAETDFDLGWHVNFHAFLRFCDAIRAEHLASGGQYVPRVVFTSSIAVFGPPYPDRIDDDFRSTPATSYGAQKAACELVLSDFSRKGFCDAVILRLPTICVRPGKANLAASSFFSGIIREPLNGQEAILPVPDTVRHWHASPRAAARFLTHAAGMNTEPLGHRRALNMPGVSVTVAEQIEALREAAGNNVVALIKSRPDPAIAKIVAGWPRDFDPARATALGFVAETGFRQIVDTYIADDLHP